MMMEKKDHHLFETKSAEGRSLFHLYGVSVFVSTCMIFVYRVSYFEERYWVYWMGLFLSEIWFTWYFFLSVVIRWNLIFRYTFKHKLTLRYGEDLPGIDIFVCTADPVIEPPIMVMNTVLSVMAYNYPTQKLSVYLSDDGGSDLTFYAMLEASKFAKIWLPFCRKFKVEPRSPQAYFQIPPSAAPPFGHHQWQSIKKSYEEMKHRIETATELGQISEEIRQEHKGFHEWDSVSSGRDHRTILQILIDGRNCEAVDIEGQPLPTLVYLAREKRPQFHHNFKAGAMNALIRVSSRISNGKIILNVDCDMYSNNSDAVRDALCFFMDEEQSHNVAYVQCPQNFCNPTKNDIYSSNLSVLQEVELAGLDSCGGTYYIGTGCFHRRDTLCGKKYSQECNKPDWKSCVEDTKIEESREVLEDTCKILASCTYEENTLWGKEMGLMYGCLVEDIITGFRIHCSGWRSVNFNPERKAFVGLAPTTLLQSLVQHKRWSEGHLQIFLSEYCPYLYGHKKIPLKQQLGYSLYSFWAVNCFATLYYVSVPSLCLLRGIALFPKISSIWIVPFAYAFFAHRAYSLGEFLWVGGTIKGWWHDQRMWVFRRTTSYLFGFTDTILKLVGFSKSAFVITAKVAEEDVSQRFEQEVMEFGVSSPMFTVLATLALLNLFSFTGGLTRVVLDMQNEVLDQFSVQIILCGLVVLINLPVYQGLFFRKDLGKMPSSVTYSSVAFALLACTIAAY
ncbi:hypothetical protein Ddye_000398 [Dipteronia dyeriana]|uniref:Cellulose synthase-like protein E6 n=1 Tax=Dipteronia dyeriana TaxID=168575 RepID=A0AAE0CSK2_9ROSI|nr:hypothetical protein Ddye_000398 [Dipteronia dyeriana]